MKKTFTNTTCLILTLGIPALIGILLSFAVPPPPHMEVVEVITIPPGVSLPEVTHLLYSKSIIRNQTLFNLLVRYRRADTQIKSGEYQFTNRMLPHDVLNKLIRGEQLKYSITIPEGLTIVQIALLYEKAGMAEKNRFVEVASDLNFIAS
ncbi:MAG TPA: endolytic transglycosylase MltG, partial [Thermodesulfobacteriota bacterium]|nr:endolytic transglycosylase MltG [Thermodesulfobacteriota bacterium]